MACMCGDTNCPSCGPAQGFNPEFERVCEWIEYDLFCDLPEGFDLTWFSEELANQLGKQPMYLVEAIERRAKEWEIEYREKQKRNREWLNH